MQKLFQSVQMRKPSKNKFDLSHERKFSFNMGDLVPILVQEVMPGDSFRVNSEVMMRMAPMLAPVMHRVNVRTEYFFVPNRLVWDEWEDFITGGRLGDAAPIHPHMRILDGNKAAFLEGSLGDYMGVPVFDPAVTVTHQLNISALPFRAYKTIWNEYYRDQNLTAPIPVSKASGIQVINDDITLMNKRAWEKDYQTSSLPFAQRGPEVLMPIEGTGSVTYMPVSEVHDASGPVGTDQFLGHDNAQAVGDLGIGSSVAGVFNVSQNARIENIDEVTLSNSTVTINELRRSIRLQEWLEKNAVGGGRYVEQILSHFGVRSSDARLQRPEYLGGGRAPMVVSEVLSTFQDDTGDIPQGNMAGHGMSYGTANGFKRTFEEHGFIIGLISVLPRTAYQQGVDKKFQRFDRFDYPWPEFAQIGEQEVKNNEIYYDAAGSPAVGDATFGYQSRYAECKYGCSSVHGAFRSTLSFWHMGRIFGGQPGLNTSFITADPTERVFAVPDANEHLYCHLFNKIDALRPLPYFGTPML